MSPIVNADDVAGLLKRDKTFVKIKIQYGLPPNFSRPQGFVTLSRIILEQQVSLQSANAHFNKLNDYLSSFSPKEILQLTDDEMRHCQISRQKAKYLKGLSTAILEERIKLEELPNLSKLNVRTELKKIKGIGDWTADIYLMFCLQEKDIFPIGDVAVLSTVRELTSAQTIDNMLALSEKWKPHRSLATYFLWHYYLKKRNREIVI